MFTNKQAIVNESTDGRVGVKGTSPLDVSVTDDEGVKGTCGGVNLFQESFRLGAQGVRVKETFSGLAFLSPRKKSDEEKYEK